MYATKRSGFAMILAIFVVVMVALGGVMLLGNASIGAKTIGDNYLHAQAQLLAESATEYAVMRAQGSTACLNRVNISVNGEDGTLAYTVNATIRYSFQNAAPVVCSVDANLSDNTGNPTMMLVDVTVTDNNLSLEPIRVFKRSWQKL